MRTSDGNTNGDIFTLVMSIKNINFGESNKWIHNLLGLKYEFKIKNKVELKNDPLYIFKKVKKNKYVVNKNIDIYDDKIIKEYSNLPHINWIKDGIMPFACERFNIGYSFDKKRITIPWRKWDGGDNDFVGVTGRTTVPLYELFDIPKYLTLKKFSKGLNLYGLNENYQTILQKGYCVVFESEKSVLKRYSRKDGTSVALGNCEITDEQVKILIGLNVEICICLDEGIELNHIRKECEKFYKIRNISYIYNKWDLMKKGSKDSPADLHNKLYNFMFKYRINYDKKEHNLYLKSLKKE